MRRIDPGERAAATWRVLWPLLLLAAPAAGYFAFIAVYGVNTIVVDQWTDVGLLQKVYAGRAGLAALWAPHNENRTLFPNLVVVALAHLTHFDTLTECYLSATLLLVAVVLVIHAQHRRSKVRLVWYLPLPLLLMTLAQYGNTLLGYQLSWYLALLAIVVSLWLLDRAELGWGVFAAAAAVAVVGSFSAFEGLLAWAAGLVLLVLRGRPPSKTVAWLVAGIATTTLYAYNLSVGSNVTLHYALQHPLATVAFFFVALGDVVGYGLSNLAPNVTADVLLGLLGGIVFAFAVFSFVRGARSPDRAGAAPFGCALIAAGLIFAVFISLARAIFGTDEAGATRFVTFDVLPIVGSYLVWLPGLGSGPPAAGRVSGVRGRRSAVVLAAALLPAAFGVYHGVEGGRWTRVFDQSASDVLVNIAKAPDGLVEVDVYPLESPEVVRRLAAVARRYRFSLFDTSQVALYERRGLDVGPSYPLFAPHR